MRPSQLLAAVVALSSLSAAWPDVFENVNALGDVKNVLYGRQDNSESDSAKPSATEAPKSSAASDQSESDKPTATDKDAQSTDKASGSQRASGTKSTGKVTATNFGNDVPAGGVQMVTPAITAGSQFYKVGDWVTFAWNYTSLKKTPSNIDILASCTANQATYTLAVNQSAKETSILWDTKAYQANASVPLLTEMYTLLIYDAESSVSATAKPGYLAVFNQFTFGMYTPQPYTPWADFNCAGCNSALSAFEKLTLKALLVTCGTTFFSLLYFAHSFGVL